jgi:hypothetical protein
LRQQPLRGRDLRLRAATLLGGLALLASASAARASERLAVVFVVEGQPDMADSLTEIAIARLAEQRGDLVGTRELRPRLPATPSGETAEACVARGECLRALRDASGADRAIIGRLTRAPQAADGWRLDLGLADLGAPAGEGKAAVKWRPQSTLPVETEQLYAGVRAAIDELIPPRLPPPAPAPAPTAAAVVTAPVPANGPAPKAESVRTSHVVALGLAGLAAASFATAIVLGTEASGTPVGATREDMQADLQRRENLATGTNVLLAAGAGLALAAAGVFIWRW